MTLNKIIMVMEFGDRRGSALRDLLNYYGIKDNDLSPITDDMADKWISRQKCKCWHKGGWLRGYDTCWGTREQEPCKCKGDRTKCDFYRNKE